jgi:hypothetical protein
MISLTCKHHKPHSQQSQRHRRSKSHRSRTSRASSSTPGPTPHSDAKSGDHFGALSHDERVSILGEAIIDSGALVFTKSHSGKYTCVDNAFLKAFGFEKSEDVVGLTDDEVIEKILASGKTFHHSYRGEAVTDLPRIWKENDDLVQHNNRTMWFKERALLSGGEDTKLHEFVVMKSPFDGGVLGVAVPTGI